MKPNFRRDLETGKAGELAVQKLWPELELLHGKGADAKLPNGDLVEIKSDSYDMAATENFFIELYGNVDTLKYGGPYKANVDGCKWYVYYYSKNNTAYIFNTLQLLRELDMYMLNFHPKLVEVRNKKWTTVGYKIPRGSVSPYCVLTAKDNSARPGQG